MLGLDPLYVANEGVAVAIVDPSTADEVLAAAHGEHPGERACAVGEVAATDGSPARVRMRTGLGATRPVIMLTGDQLPRIC